LCQQRALSKELNPGYWESFVGGHHRPGETYAEAAERELREELDISASPEDLRLWRVYRFNDPKGSNNEFQGVFTIHWDGDLSSLRFTDGEVEQVKWQDAKSIGNFIKSQSTPWTFCGYELDLIEYIENRKI
jgi:isopentenyldiphosphate isomerase